MIRFGTVSFDGDIAYNNDRCKLKINSGEFERGTLSLTNREICWKKQNSEDGFMIPWEKVTVQAISNDPERCVYFMIDVIWPDQVSNRSNGSANGNYANNEQEEANDGSADEGNDSEGSVQELTEFYIVTDSENDIDEIYFIMTKFPEAEPMNDDDSDDDFFDGENIEQMNINEEGDHDRFADAE